MVDNRGRDIRPFIKAIKVADGFGYKYICKVHTKNRLIELMGSNGVKVCSQTFLDHANMFPKSLTILNFMMKLE